MFVHVPVQENGACFRNTLQTLEKELGGCLHKGVSRCRDALASSLGSFNGVSHNWAASDISSILKHMSELISFGNAFDSLQNAGALVRLSLTVQPASEEKYLKLTGCIVHAHMLLKTDREG